MIEPNDDFEDRREQDEALVKSHVARLCEHFDAVQIFVTSQKGDVSMTYCSGGGNWYSRYGQITEWIVKQEEIARAEMRTNGE